MSNQNEMNSKPTEDYKNQLAVMTDENEKYILAAKEVMGKKSITNEDLKVFKDKYDLNKEKIEDLDSLMNIKDPKAKEFIGMNRLYENMYQAKEGNMSMDDIKKFKESFIKERKEHGIKDEELENNKKTLDKLFSEPVAKLKDKELEVRVYNEVAKSEYNNENAIDIADKNLQKQFGEFSKTDKEGNKVTAGLSVFNANSSNQRATITNRHQLREMLKASGIAKEYDEKGLENLVDAYQSDIEKGTSQVDGDVKRRLYQYMGSKKGLEDLSSIKSNEEKDYNQAQEAEYANANKSFKDSVANKKSELANNQLKKVNTQIEERKQNLVADKGMSVSEANKMAREEVLKEEGLSEADMKMYAENAYGKPGSDRIITDNKKTATPITNDTVKDKSNVVSNSSDATDKINTDVAKAKSDTKVANNKPAANTDGGNINKSIADEMADDYAETRLRVAPPKDNEQQNNNNSSFGFQDGQEIKLVLEIDGQAIDAIARAVITKGS